MLDLPTVLKNIAIDPSLKPVDVRVYIVASQLLDDRLFRELPLIAVALPIGLRSRSRAHGAIRRLCEQGYLERGPRPSRRGAVTYRLAPHLIALG